MAISPFEKISPRSTITMELAGRLRYNDSANAIETILKLNEIRVPDDVVLLSFDHNPARISRPCLCSKPYEMGCIAVARLIEKIQKPDSPVRWSIIPMTLEGVK